MLHRFVVVLSRRDLPRSVLTLADYEKNKERRDIWVQYKLYVDLEICEAASATLAATSFFRLIDKDLSGRIKTSSFPGTLEVHNPVNELWHEAAAEWGSDNLEVTHLLSSFDWHRNPDGRNWTNKINNAKEAQTTANYFHIGHMVLFEKHKVFRFMAPILLNEEESKSLVGIPSS
jgi:hypothetical protein